MKKLDSVKSVVCAQEHGMFRYFAWPSVTRLPDGTLAAACSGFRLAHVCPFGKVVICYSRDEGKTWSLPMTAIDTPLDDRDAGLTVFGDGRVFLSSFTLGGEYYSVKREPNAIAPYDAFTAAALDYAYALDEPEKYLGATYRISEDGGYTFGPILTSPVSTPHGPIRLNDGSLLYVGRRHSQTNTWKDTEPPALQVWQLNEKDEWEKLADIPNIFDEHGWLLSCEPHAIQLPDGKIIVLIRVQRNDPRVFSLYQCESTDGGRSFTQPHQVLSDLGGAPAHLLLHSSGRLIASYGYREHPYGIRIMFSDDGGNTWDTDYILEDESPCHDTGYPATVELRDGSLLTVYYTAFYTPGKPAVSSIFQRVWRLPEKE